MPGSTALNLTSGGVRVLDRDHRDRCLARAVHDRRVARGRPGWVVRRPERAQRARDVHHDRVRGFPQQAQGSLGDADDAHRVGVEHLERAGPVERFTTFGAPGDAGVDEHVEAAVGLDLRESGRDRSVVGHVELDEASTELLGRGATTLLVAGSDIGGVPGGHELAGDFLAEPLVGPGHEGGRHASSFGAHAGARESSACRRTARATTPADREGRLGHVERGAFGQAVRRWRDRVSPDAVGLPTSGRRRATGLRREELAGLTGISVDYLTRLEQRRATSVDPSPRCARPRAAPIRPRSGTSLPACRPGAPRPAGRVRADPA